ncbi:substrate-binding domain-containing protein [Maribacter sp. LLG6340-A2]|uniref:substrate-binding domain-containing protein n=1 Tax=Maribacter sp. LLG6340-A2 TaxID=3160834 RepID=UPI00386D5CEB
MKTVRIIGVPEHFNFPWHLAIDEGAFEERGIALEWTDVPEGTGKMCNLLKEEKADLAIILTEGIVKSITEGNTTKIIQEYIASPLLWGIHVDVNSNFKKLAELENTTAAISRFGSGSHLMAYVHAKQMGWNLEDLKFNTINNLEGAVQALTTGNADYFMWEHFTTKPLVDAGIFRHLGDCPTPWPCFVLAGTDSFIAENNHVIGHIREIINAYTLEFKQIPSIDRTLANRYQQKLADIQEWMQLTQWSQKQLPKHTLLKVQETLLELNLIDQRISADKILM